jgi:hypothetical protein
METQFYFTMQKNLYLIFIFLKSFKRNQNPSRYYYYNSIITNLKFQHKPKLSSFKNPPIKIKPIITIIIT